MSKAGKPRNGGDNGKPSLHSKKGEGEPESLKSPCLFGESLTLSEYRAAIQNLADFFTILRNWSHREKGIAEKDTPQDQAD